MLTITGCNRNSNGTYLVYKIKQGNEFYGVGNDNDTISSYLHDQLIGTKIDLRFEDNYLSVKSHNNQKEVILERDEANGKPFYTSQSHVNSIKIHLEVRTDDSGHLTYVVEIDFPKSQPLILPVQLGGPFIKSRTGRAICYLSKVNE